MVKMGKLFRQNYGKCRPTPESSYSKHRFSLRDLQVLAHEEKKANTKFGKCDTHYKDLLEKMKKKRRSGNRDSGSIFGTFSGY